MDWKKLSAFELLGLFLFVIAFLFFIVWIEMLLWNGVAVKAVDWANPISYWQMFGLSILIGLLFGKVSSTTNKK